MPVNITRKKTLFQPDNSRVIARFLYAGDERAIELLRKLLAMPVEQQHQVLAKTLRDFSKRHRSISHVFEKNFTRIAHLFAHLNTDVHSLTHEQRLLFGAYFTMEYSVEAAAFFNPSIVESTDQSGLLAGEKRVILSFRATGEGHISSIVFRCGVINASNDIEIAAPGKMLESPAHVKNHQYHKTSFRSKLKEMQDGNSAAYAVMMDKLTPSFTYEELKRYVEETRPLVKNDMKSQVLLNEIMWLASSHYEISFSLDTDISERVIFPIADTEMKGIEDARFVRFIDPDGGVTFYATYTAYDGVTILPKLILTKDFYHFTVMPIHGEVAQNKGMALFPRKINGKYVMLCRGDGVNNYISFSDNINIWREVTLLQSPEQPWELVQMGNGGSPLETPEGWIVITHGVGPVRQYVLGVSLLDLEDPTKVIGRLKEPLLIGNDQEREGYVPNVVYSCGSIIHNDHLIIPYAMSDHASTYATVNLTELLAALKEQSTIQIEPSIPG
jgi:beta-1,2-mannobiose phosphorylase / 1,2-beta-oligomannan phosphorylase